MDGWWADIEAHVGAALREHGELSVAQVAAALGVSEAAAASLLQVLAGDGRVRIVRIAAVSGRSV
jgi:predicted ArsR family transcriptional regulator